LPVFPGEDNLQEAGEGDLKRLALKVEAEVSLDAVELRSPACGVDRDLVAGLGLQEQVLEEVVHDGAGQKVRRETGLGKNLELRPT
jgi:hypothetical protein